MKILFATYPMAFHTPGGGEVQLLAYSKFLPIHGVDVTLIDPWNPQFLEHDVVHFFSCVGGSLHFCSFIKKLGLPLVISSSLWITEETKMHYPMDRFYTPDEFAEMKEEALGMGFMYVESGPLVRSSYHADEQIKNT